MNIQIQKAKNEENTAVIQNHFLHSGYAPSKEAVRFVENLNITFSPYAIIISEPALSYVVIPLREKYPQAKIGAIRYTDFFNSYNSLFDFVINLFEDINLEARLETLFNEEQLLSVHFISWQPCSQVFTEEDKLCWNAIKSTLERAKTLLITRQYFEKKWLLNCAHFLQCIKNPVILENKINRPVLIISSGPSFQDAIKVIKENQKKFFIICLSSALLPCLENEIIPDLCMSSDGGFWAGQHLKKLSQSNVVLALPSEALCPKTILEKTRILPLVYEDGISAELSQASGIKYMKAVRNGTVSGTALIWAIQNSTKDIYLTGLDMAAQKGFQHTQPNELEKNSSLKDSRISTKEKRLTASEFSGASLEIYRRWFENFDFTKSGKKIFRVINNQKKKNTLGKISDIDVNSFNEILQKLKTESSDINLFSEQKLTDIKASEKAAAYLQKTDKREEWSKQLFPLDYVLLSHSTEKEETLQKISKNYNELITKVKKILYE